MVLRAFRNNPKVLVNDFQSIKNGQRKDGYPDYSFFDQTVPQEKVLIGKETIGYGTLADCRLEIFPRSRFAELVIETIPLFCFRDPFRTFNSWCKNNLVFPTIGPKFFIEAYKWSYEMYLQARKKNHNVALCVYEQFCEMPERTLRAICTRWDIPYDKRMISWKDDVTTMPFDHNGVTDGYYHRVTDPI